MSAVIKAHQDEIRALMQAALNGEMPEADAVRTIILLQRELINALMSSHSLNGTDGAAMDGGASLDRKAA